MTKKVVVSPEDVGIAPGDAKNKKKTKDAVKKWNKKIKGKIKQYKKQTKYDQNLHYNVLGVQLPTAVSNFFRANTARFKILVRSLEIFPLELAVHVIHDFNLIAVVIFIGFLAIALWMAFEEIAIYGGEQVLKVIFTVFEVIVILLDIMIDWLVFWILGPIVTIIQVLMCDPGGWGIPKPNVRSDFLELICNDIPGPGNPTIIPVPKEEDFIPAIWDFMKKSKDTCAEFSTGLEELQVMPKLFLSPFICPILHHVRPVPWLYDLFFYTLGWATWEQGIERTYEAPWATAVTNKVMTDGINNSRKCEAPPNALFCFILGFGFLIIEILVPILIIMLAIKPLKDAVGAIIGIAFSVLYYTINFTLWTIEKATHVADWAGRKYAWIVILVVPLVITSPVGYQLYGDDGLFGGSAAGLIVGTAVILEHTPNEKAIGGVSHGTIMTVSGTMVVLLIGAAVINGHV